MAELRDEADKAKKKLANMSKTNSNNTSVCNGDSKSKSGRKLKSSKNSTEIRSKGDKSAKKSRGNKPYKSSRHDTVEGSRDDNKKDRRSRGKERKRKYEDKYTEEREQDRRSVSGRKSSHTQSKNDNFLDVIIYRLFTSKYLRKWFQNEY